MAGVSGPLLRRDRAGGTRFLIGLTAGGMVAGIVLALPAYLLGSLAQAVLPLHLRLWLVAAACVAFGVADLADRTPHVWRQVPQRFVHRLTPGTLGVTWGFDLGLLFTTQKVTSLIWVATMGVVLLEPAVAAVLLVGVSLVSSVTVTLWSMSERTSGLAKGRRERWWVRNIRRTSGIALLVPAILVSLQAL
jgi:hypothetical protein